MRHPVRDRVDNYLEGLLDSRAQEDFERHLGACFGCREALNAAREARQCIEWLAPADAPPEPGPDFYARVARCIEHKRTSGWFGTLAASMQPRLVYPLVFLGLLLVAWTLTYDAQEPDDGFLAMEYPAIEFAQMTFSHADEALGHDLVMLTLVELPEED